MFEQISFVSKGMTSNSFKRYVQIIEEEANKKISTFELEGKINLFQILQELIITTASRCLLGDEICNHLSDKEFAGLYYDLDKGLNPITFFLPWFKYSSGAPNRDKARKKIHETFLKIINLRRKNKKEYDDTLQILMTEKYKSGETISDEHIIGIIIAGLFAGQHTSSVASTWTLLNILNNPEILKRILIEQNELVEINEKLSYEKIEKMEFLKMSMKESLRLAPPIILIFRLVKKKKKN